jgi:hypothetical protein
MQKQGNKVMFFPHRFEGKCLFVDALRKTTLLKAIFLWCILIMGILHSHSALHAQRCYTQIIDASGLPMNTSELGVLEQTACELRDAFPVELRPQFGVFDFSSYLHNESMKGQYEQVYNNALQKVKGEKPFYLFFARQTNQGGPNTGLRVVLNIPKTGYFGCFQEWERDVLDAKLIRLFESSARSGAVAQGEVAAMKQLKEVVDYLVGCCYVSNLRRGGECKSPLLDEYVVNNFKLYQVTFLGGQIIRLDNGTAVEKPHWHKEAVNARRPILYLHGTVIRADVDFSYGGTIEEFKNKTENIDNAKKLRISAVVKANNGKGIFTSKIIPSEITITDAEKKMIGLRGAAFDVPLPNGINYFKEFKVEWYIHSPDKSSPTLLGTTSNPMYVTTQVPKNNRLRETYFYLGCSNSIGEDTESKIFEGIWKHFINRNLKNALGEPLIYYGSPLVENISANGLLVTKDGQCGSFVDLLRGSMAALGFENVSVVAVTKKVEFNSSDEGFIVKNWIFSNKEPSIKYAPNYTHYNYDDGSENIFHYDSNTKTYSWSIIHVMDAEGIAGQNNSNPVSDFQSHYIVNFNNFYYDPSYGAEKFSSKEEWASKSLAGFFMFKQVDIDNQLKWVCLFRKYEPGLINP